MSVTALPRRYPIPTLTTAAFAVAFVTTAAYYAGFVPGVPKTLPTFVDLLTATGAFFALAVLAWTVSVATE